jgi:hypothetical protein
VSHSATTGLFAWQRALRGASLPPTVQHVLLLLATYADGDGTSARPGEERLAAAAGLSTSTVRRALALARRLGWVVRSAASTARSRGRGRADEYALTVPGQAPAEPAPAGRGRRLCAHADRDGAGMHWLESGERCPDAPPATGRPRPVDGRGHRAPVVERTGHQRPGAPGTGARSPEQDHPADQIRPGAAALGGLARVVVETIREVTGRTVDPFHARLVVRQLVGDRAGVRNPAAYVAGAIRRDADPGRFLPTPVPPRFVAGLAA